MPSSPLPDGPPSISIKYIARPPLVHFKKEIMGSAGVTRCGIPYEARDKTPTLTTAWYSDVTCPECSPP
jgi:hypothetical protein